MSNLNYKVCDPSGNITILVTDEVPKEKRIAVADELLKVEPSGQQVGFVSKGDSSADLIINMAGDEFCGNATLSGASLFKQQNEDADIVRIKISGAKEIINVKVIKQQDEFVAIAKMPAPDYYGYKTMSFNNKEYRTYLVTIGSMLNLVMIDKLKEEDIKPAIKQWYQELGCSALGLMDYDEDTKELIPAVLSNNGEFFCYESSCASGTTALAIYLAESTNSEIVKEIKEPGGVLKITSRPGGYVELTNTIKIRD